MDDGRCLRGAAGRCLAHCRGGDDALAYVRSARALAAWLAGEEAVLDAPLRARVARLVEQQRFEDAARATRLLDALRAADAQVSNIRRARRRTGVLLASDLDPRHVVAFAVVRGALVAKRRLPRQGDPGLELGAVAAALERALDPAAALEPRAEGPWLPAERYSEALLLAQAFAGRAAGVVPVACTAPDALALRRVAAARRARPRCASRCRPAAIRAPRSSRRSHDGRFQVVERPATLESSSGRGFETDPGGSLTGVASSFRERLERLAAERRSVLCVGLDPRPELFPDELFRGVREGPAGLARAMRALLHGHRRGRGRARRGGQAAAGVLRAGRASRPRGGRARRARSRASAGCS